MKIIKVTKEYYETEDEKDWGTEVVDKDFCKRLIRKEPKLLKPHYFAKMKGQRGVAQPG